MANISNYLEYKNKSTRTMPDLGKSKNETHMMAGLFTEKAEIIDVLKKKIAYDKEIDMINLKEEIGDFMWYFVNAELVIEKELGSFDHYKYITENAKAERELIKKISIEKFTSELLKIDFGSGITRFSLLLAGDFISKVLAYFNIDFMECLNSNYEKLLKRYPEGFNTDKAVNRDLDTERKTLEDNS